MNLNYKLRRYLVKSNQRKMAKYNLAPQQIKCYNLIRSLLTEKTSKLCPTLETNKRYIQNGKMDIDVIISNEMIFLSNHTYSYYVHLPDEHIKALYRLFSKRLERECNRLDVKMTKNVVNSLSKLETELGL